MFFGMLPKLETVDDVLPKNVAAGAYGAQRCEVRVRHPNGERGNRRVQEGALHEKAGPRVKEIEISFLGMF